MSVNWTVSARLHKLEPCPECDAEKSSPCLTTSGMPRAPHRIREKVEAGEVVVITLDAARAARRVRALHELLGAIRGSR